MADTGFVFPTTAVNDASVGTQAWGNPDRIFSDNVLTSTASSSGASTSNLIVGSGFGFAVPSGSTIDGIELIVEHRKGGTNSGTFNVTDNIVKLFMGGLVVGNNKAGTSGISWTTSFQIATYGSPTDDWGIGLSAEDVNDAGFGAGISVSLGGSSLNAQIDYIQMKVYYTEAGGGSGQNSGFFGFM